MRDACHCCEVCLGGAENDPCGHGTCGEGLTCNNGFCGKCQSYAKTFIMS